MLLGSPELPGKKSDDLAGETRWEGEALRLHGGRARPSAAVLSIQVTLDSAAIWLQTQKRTHTDPAEEPPGRPTGLRDGEMVVPVLRC